MLSDLDEFDGVGALLQDFPKDDLIDMYSIHVEVYLNDSYMPSSE